MTPCPARRALSRPCPAQDTGAKPPSSRPPYKGRLLGRVASGYGQRLSRPAEQSRPETRNRARRAYWRKDDQASEAPQDGPAPGETEASDAEAGDEHARGGRPGASVGPGEVRLWAEPVKRLIFASPGQGGRVERDGRAATVRMRPARWLEPGGCLHCGGYPAARYPQARISGAGPQLARLRGACTAQAARDGVVQRQLHGEPEAARD